MRKIIESEDSRALRKMQEWSIRGSQYLCLQIRFVYFGFSLLKIRNKVRESRQKRPIICIAQPVIAPSSREQGCCFENKWNKNAPKFFTASDGG
jgi:hypothetical protein